MTSYHLIIMHLNNISRLNVRNINRSLTHIIILYFVMSSIISIFTRHF